MAKAFDKRSESTDADSMPLSTRFTSKQKAAIEQAAAIVNCTPAKLVREASLRRAADVINASGNARNPLRELAKRTLHYVVNPRVEIRWISEIEGQPDEIEFMTVRHWESLDVDELQADYQHHQSRGYTGPRVIHQRPDAAEVRQIQTAIRSCPSEFVALMLEQWDDVESGGQQYKPQVDVDELLSGESEENQ
jgi:hypothetical protein